MIGIAQHDARAVGQAVAPRRHLPPHLSETVQLLRVLGHVLVRRGQMADAAIDGQRLQHRIAQIAHRQTQAVDAGIDHDMTRAAASGGPAPGLLQRIEHRPHAAFERECHVGIVQRSMQHGDLLAGTCGSSAAASLQCATNQLRHPARASSGTTTVAPMP
jgi:hypothetical protein